MSIRQAYDVWAATYNEDRNLTRDLDAQITRKLLGVRHGAAVLELGCGTGKNTPLLTEIAGQVLAFDFSEAMIAQASAKHYVKPVLFAMVDLTNDWPCARDSINLVTANLVLEHIADLERVFAQVRRVLVPGGHFFISELHPFSQYQGKKANFARGSEQVEIAAFVHHISDFLTAAAHAGFSLQHLGEWWHEEDSHKPPRLLTLLFEQG